MDKTTCITINAISLSSLGFEPLRAKHYNTMILHRNCILNLMEI